MTDFSGLNLIEPIARAVKASGYSTPTAIQAQAIPHVLEGHDLLGVAQTGTGKTAAFSLPLLQRLSESSAGRPESGRPRALILAPTRELAGQIGECIRTYGRHLNLRHLVVFGGTPLPRQAKVLAQGVDIVVATPGRLMDLMARRHLRLDRVEIFVLDEADRMLDMGFVRDVKKIAEHLPSEHQTVLFSATMPEAVRRLAAGIMRSPVRVDVAPTATTVERIDQRVLFVAKENKRALLTRLLGDEDIERVLIFTRTKHGADRVARHLDQGGVRTGAIHGNKPQKARETVLKGFRSGRIRALVATDIAARGIDVTGVTHVINFELPVDPDSYVHRIGRTARAGASGVAISFCDAQERGTLRSIEKTIRQSVPVDEDHPYHVVHVARVASADRAAPSAAARRRRPQKRRFRAKAAA